MITIMLAKDEKKTQEMILTLLKENGYDVAENLTSGTISASNKREGSGAGTLEQKVIEISKVMHTEKRGDIYKAIVEQVERPVIEYALERAEGNQLKAARVLGINRNTMRAKIRKFGIDASKWKI